MGNWGLPEEQDYDFLYRSRFKWDFQALETFMELTRLLLETPDFVNDLELLYAEAPASVQIMRFDIVWGYIPPDTDWHPRLSDLILPHDGATNVTPGDISQVEQRYSASWQTAQSLVGHDHPWLKQVDSAVHKWGLLARWGPGVLLEMMVDWEARKRRINGESPEEMPFFELTWNMRRVPHLPSDCPVAYPPTLSPGMSDQQWNEEVEKYRLEGLAVLKNWRRSLPNSEIWKASYSEMTRHTSWLFRRITPPYLTPVMQAEEYSEISTRAIENGIRKTAKLRRLRVSPGVRHARKARGLDRKPRRPKGATGYL
jgi:hypothetical protein